MVSNRRSYFKQYWKLGIHLVCKTRRFGVNNRWWSSYASLWGVSPIKVFLRILFIFPLIREYRIVKVRMGTSFGFVMPEDFLLKTPNKKTPNKISKKTSKSG